MEPQQARVQEDLRGLISGDVRCDDVFLQMYASDASVYQIKPLGMVRPKNTADVAACVQYAAAQHIPIHARGAGTGLAGESLGPGLVLDFSSYFRRILHDDHESVRVQPGVVHERLNAYLRSRGRTFGPDPATSAVTTMGSVVAVDGSGSHWLKYGSTRRHVRKLRAVLADASVMEFGQEPLVGGVSHDPDPHKRQLINQLADVLSRHQDLIARHQPKSLVNRFGYNLADVYTPSSLDVARLLTGSEGTLALFTEITVATQSLARYRALGLLSFESLENAARAVQEIMPFRPVACDLMDRRHLSLARETDARFEPLIPPAAEAVLCIEMDGDDSIDVRDRLRLAVERVRGKKRLAFDARQSAGGEEMLLFEQLSRKVVPTLYRLKGSTRALPFVEDFAVPPETLTRFLVEMQNVLKRHQVTATLYAHAGHGQIHLRPFLDLGDPAHVRLMELLAGDLYEAVLQVGGTISGEHAAGLSRTAFIPRQYGELAQVFTQIKRVFDPANILNPGKVVGQDPYLLTRNLRPAAEVPAPAPAEPAAGGETPRQLVELHLNWTQTEVEQMARSCNGCGACRSQESGTRMCPIFRFAPAEEASPRAKANMMRGLFNGQLDPDSLKQAEFKAVADLCVNCQMCRLECPASVDIPKLMLEAKAGFVANDGLRLGDWVLTRLDFFSGLGSLLGPLANWAIGNRQARWLLEKTIGLAQARKLPRFAARSFIRRAHRRRLTRATRRSGRKVLYFVDTYANFHDPQLGEALVAVLEHNGVAVYVPPGQTQSGMAMLSVGAVERARPVARRNVELLAEAVRQGFTIVTSEPSAALCLKLEYPTLLDDDDARLVAENTVEACTYLWNLHQVGKLQLDMKPVNAALAYHMPCHMKALEVGSPGESLLRLIPALVVQRIERGCSGMAGTFGLKKRNYRNSLRAGWPLISSLRESPVQAGTTECSACKMQIEQGTGKPTVHPIKLLALAYGLMPEVASLLSARPQELFVT
ncbi:MAG TPA: anaerobic glycerol-3-phosphate dehydrogenase subunit C [Pirellulales bacterium]|nr:anaerobic glycerol-3-phosphate dehydrogenase subunit C [Pirellulales bacterium]